MEFVFFGFIGQGLSKNGNEDLYSAISTLVCLLSSSCLSFLCRTLFIASIFNLDAIVPINPSSLHVQTATISKVLPIRHPRYHKNRLPWHYIFFHNQIDYFQESFLSC